MSWELLKFELEETGPVQVFNFEARLRGADDTLEWRGDGVYISRSRALRLNREAELGGLLRDHFAPPPPPYSGRTRRSGFDPQPLIAELAEVLTAHVATVPVRQEPRQAVAAGAASGMAGMAYGLKWMP